MSPAPAAVAAGPACREDANAAERAAELGGLRAAGMPRRMLDRLIAAENLLLAVAAVPIGLVLSASWSPAGACPLTTTSCTGSRCNSGHGHPRGHLIVLAAAVLAQIPALRTLARLDIARIVRERSL